MIELFNMTEIQNKMNSKGFHLFYLSRPECGVCAAVKAKVNEMIKKYPLVETYYVNLNTVPEAAGQYSIFTIPAILLYADGREMIREARYLSVSSLDDQIDRYYSLAFGES